ncbi:MAG: CehA/McbA family metallohydrolase [Armatimonadota bacterium]
MDSTQIDWWDDQEANWYRGNLHTHTSESDGRRSPEEACRWFHEHGYDFVQLTDHMKVVSGEPYCSESFLAITSCELHGARSELGHPLHILALGLQEHVMLEAEDDALTMVRKVREAGAEVIVAHPYWSGLTLNDLLPLEDIIGIEVWNTTCSLLNGKGTSNAVWDDLLVRGRRLLGCAVDDAHWGRRDYGRGWILVKARELTRDAILEAIRQRRFYSSTGPRILRMRLQDGRLHVSCSEVAAINLVCDAHNGRCVEADLGSLLTEAEFDLPEGVQYARVECIDERGHAAWTNPLFASE